VVRSALYSEVNGIVVPFCAAVTPSVELSRNFAYDVAQSFFFCWMMSISEAVSFRSSSAMRIADPILNAVMSTLSLVEASSPYAALFATEPTDMSADRGMCFVSTDIGSGRARASTAEVCITRSMTGPFHSSGIQLVTVMAVTEIVPSEPRFGRLNCRPPVTVRASKGTTSR
jgi:hypothetical protein